MPVPTPCEERQTFVLGRVATNAHVVGLPLHVTTPHTCREAVSLPNIRRFRLITCAHLWKANSHMRTFLELLAVQLEPPLVGSTGAVKGCPQS